MKSICAAALVCIFLAGALGACGDDAIGPVIYVDSPAAGFSGKEIADAVAALCEDSCNGILGDSPASSAQAKGLEIEDADVVKDLVLLQLDLNRVSFLNILFSQRFFETTRSLASATELTFGVTQEINCNSTGIEPGELGDETGGVIRQTVIWTATFNSAGDSYYGPVAQSNEIDFENCVIAGDLLNEATSAGAGKGDGNGSAVRLNGHWRFSYHGIRYRDVIDPRTDTVRGTITLETDRDNDGSFGDEFWTPVVDLNVNRYDFNDSGYYNGGLCLGQMVALGTIGDSTQDDVCAADTDLIEDYFWPGDAFYF